jgi:hypothetical protein
MQNLFDESYERGQLIKTVAAAAIPERLTSKAITSIARAGTTRKCVVTTTTPHGYTNGARVYISGANEAEFNNTTRGLMITVLTDTTFAILIDGTTAAATGTLVCYADMFVRQATVLGMKAERTANAGDVWVGTSATNDLQPYVISPSREIYLNFGMPAESRINLGSYYLDVGNAGDGAIVLYS